MVAELHIWRREGRWPIWDLQTLELRLPLCLAVQLQPFFSEELHKIGLGRNRTLKRGRTESLEGGKTIAAAQLLFYCLSQISCTLVSGNCRPSLL